MRTDFMLVEKEIAFFTRQLKNEKSLVHHYYRGSENMSIRYSERLDDAGIEKSVDSRGDGFDNAQIETINGLYNAEYIHRRVRWKTNVIVELTILQWVDSTNHDQLLERIEYIQSAKADENYANSHIAKR